MKYELSRSQLENLSIKYRICNKSNKIALNKQSNR